MKNLKFSLHDFAGRKILSREEMKNVFGGVAEPEYTSCKSNAVCSKIKGWCPDGTPYTASCNTSLGICEHVCVS